MRAIIVYISLIAIISIFTCERWNEAADENILNGTAIPPVTDTVAFKNMLGVNAFEWNFLESPIDPNNHISIYEPKMQLIQSFGMVRHYLDWVRIEDKAGKYTFNPTHSGSWNLDTMYARCKTDKVEALVCLKTCPDWLLQTYPADQRDAENVPVPYGADKASPASYILQARAAFQFAARYGTNTRIDRKLILVDTSYRWTGDAVNEVKTGLNLIKYIECDNERDKWWKGEKAHQTANEYAANLSAFYDGHKGSLGKGVGIKNADPSMQVVMAGLAAPNVDYVENMVEWCKNNRGYKANGSVDLCFDIINYHFYANDHKQHLDGKAKQGIAPELSEAPQTAADFVALGRKYNLPVWVTEAGYDINSGSTQRAISIGKKNALLTQADWLIRTSLLYARYGIQKLFFYELYDDNLESQVQYASSGLLTNTLQRKPAANYIAQLKTLLGNYSYRATINQYPLVDRYQYGKKIIYALTLPTQAGTTINYTLKLPGVKRVLKHELQAGSTTTKTITQNVLDGMFKLQVSETPVFVEVID